MPAARKTATEQEVNPLSQNMRFYSKVMVTPPEAQKPFDNGSFKGTDINPMYRIQKLTELFGPSGFGWWTKDVRYDFVEAKETNEISVFCELELYVKDPETGEVSQPIYGIGGNTYIRQWRNGPKASDEAKKMAYTDALGIACKALGIGHDIWYANDKTKYTMYSDEPAKPASTAKPEASSEPKADDVAALQSRIQRGLQMLTKDMDAAGKRAFLNEVIVPQIGQEDYRSCKDPVKLNNLLSELLARSKKVA